MRTTAEQRRQRLAVLEKLIERKAEYRSHEFELERAVLLDLGDCLNEVERQHDALERYADEEPLARSFHEFYETLAPEFGYETREQTRRHWDEVPEANKKLMVAVARAIGETARKALAAEVEVIPPTHPLWHEAMRIFAASVCWRYVGEQVDTVCILERGHDEGLHEPKGESST